jgi:hypothetical protein
MKRKLGIIFLAALAMEAMNFRFGGLALDPGSFSDMPWYLQLAGTERGLLHAVGFIGLIILDWFKGRGASGSPGLLQFTRRALCLQSIFHRIRIGEQGQSYSSAVI